MLTMHSCLDDSDSDGGYFSRWKIGKIGMTWSISPVATSIVKKKRKRKRKKEHEDAVEHPSERGRVTRSMARKTPSFASLTTC